MPWTVKDVDKHKKGLTSSQKKKWVSIANSVLRDCQKKGGSDCEGKAIRVANSNFERDGKMSKKIPIGALCLAGVDSQAICLEDGENKKPKLNMLAYSGKTIKGHWWWGDLTLDCKGVRLAAKTFPILESHDPDLKIAFSRDPIIGDDGIRINSEKTSFVSTEESEKFRKISAEGFPYQSSVRARPLKIERIEEGEKAEVNGFSVKGPHTIFRDWEMSEASVCVFGWDNKTSASAFSKEEVELELEYIIKKKADDDPELNYNKEGGEKIMDLKELMEKHPELVKQIEEDAVKEAEAKFNKEREGFQNQITEMKTNMEKQDERILEFEKRETIRTEKELQVEADRIWDAKLAESDIRPELYPKVRKHVKFSKFTKDGIFNKEDFSKAVDDEIKDWVDRGATQTVLGQGSKTREETSLTKEQEQAKKEEEEALARLQKRAGRETKDKE